MYSWSSPNGSNCGDNSSVRPSTQVSLCWVKGHSGVSGNELADQAAKTAAISNLEHSYSILPQSFARSRAHSSAMEAWTLVYTQDYHNRKLKRFATSPIRLRSFLSKICLGMATTTILTGHGHVLADLALWHRDPTSFMLHRLQTTLLLGVQDFSPTALPLLPDSLPAWNYLDGNGQQRGTAERGNRAIVRTLEVHVVQAMIIMQFDFALTNVLEPQLIAQQLPSCKVRGDHLYSTNSPCLQYEIAASDMRNRRHVQPNMEYKHCPSCISGLGTLTGYYQPGQLSPGSKLVSIHGRDPTIALRGSFCLLRFRPGPVHSSSADLEAPSSPGVAILTLGLVRTSSQHREPEGRAPRLKPSTKPGLQVAGLQEHATAPSRLLFLELLFQLLSIRFHRRVKAKTSLQDDNVPIDDTTQSRSSCRNKKDAKLP
ncbi:hypothetical protein LAZ67_3004331 [Cordylochernes scorpioides]|uniref:RNase H type-1 domain-containing protein n=1 Tax=Cordylochernes scorpioides TaxID=51811 RepID=A0ABY6K9Q5_9ARAC|nr:hypothetical protein LAZ67_3004331 [Cordylochernes scorpioides]